MMRDPDVDQLLLDLLPADVDAAHANWNDVVSRAAGRNTRRRRPDTTRWRALGLIAAATVAGAGIAAARQGLPSWPDLWNQTTPHAAPHDTGVAYPDSAVRALLKGTGYHLAPGSARAFAWPGGVKTISFRSLRGLRCSTITGVAIGGISCFEAQTATRPIFYNTSSAGDGHLAVWGLVVSAAVRVRISTSAGQTTVAARGGTFYGVVPDGPDLAAIPIDQDGPMLPPPTTGGPTTAGPYRTNLPPPPSPPPPST